MSRLRWLPCVALILAGCASTGAGPDIADDRGVAVVGSGTVEGLLTAMDEHRAWSGRIVGTVRRVVDACGDCEQRAPAEWRLFDDSGSVQVEFAHLDDAEATLRRAAEQKCSVVVHITLPIAARGATSTGSIEPTRLLPGPAQERVPATSLAFGMNFGWPLPRCKVCGEYRARAGYGGDGKPEKQF